MFESTEPAIQVALLFEQLNYSVNFFLYVFCNRRFRDEFKLSIRALCVNVRQVAPNAALSEMVDRTP